MSPIPSHKVLAQKIKEEKEKSVPAMLKPIVYANHVPEVMKYHSTASKTIIHPKTNVCPTISSASKSNAFSSNFNGAFESFLNKPNITVLDTPKRAFQVKVKSVEPKAERTNNNNSTVKTAPAVKAPSIQQTQPAQQFPAVQQSQPIQHNFQATQQTYQTQQVAQYSAQSNQANGSSQNYTFPDEKKRTAYPAARSRVADNLVTSLFADLPPSITIKKVVSVETPQYQNGQSNGQQMVQSQQRPKTNYNQQAVRIFQLPLIKMFSYFFS